MKISKVIELIQAYPDVEFKITSIDGDDQPYTNEISGVEIYHDSEGEVFVSLKN